MGIAKLIVCAIAAYLIGSVQTSILFSRAKHDDIRTHGSGNAGATNMVRTYGFKAGILTFLCDFAKAFVAVGVAKLIECIGIGNNSLDKLLIYVAGLFVVLGHDFPVYFGFKGGKGVSTSIAVLFAVYGLCNGDWFIPIATLIMGLIVIVITNTVSIGSLFGTAAQLVMCLIVYGRGKNTDAVACVLSFILFTVIYVRHSKNIRRIFRGEESKLIKKRVEKAEPKNDNIASTK